MRFRERVQVPLSWWVFAVLFAATLAGAFGFYLGRGWALGIGLPALVFVGLGFLARALPPTRAVLGGATGPALIPVLAATGAAELIWSVLVAVPLLVLG